MNLFKKPPLRIGDKTAYVFTGGDFDKDGIADENLPDATAKENRLILAADAGYRHALEVGYTPDLLLGDMDSIGDIRLPDGLETVTVPREKDYTDTQLAVDTALARMPDCASVVILGGLGGRLDHTLSVMWILEDLWYRGFRRTVIDTGNCRVHYLRDDSILIPRFPLPYISLIPVDSKVRGVEIDGVKYPLKGVTLTRKFQFAVSNELTGNCAFVTVRRGGLFVIESKDAI